ncbi:MAG: outer membrane beta-barrel protein [Saprospiraceae bacterium]
MEDNLQNDKLEEFLKNSFEDYSENPPGDLWGRIEGGLAPAPATPVRFLRWWGVAAAAAVVAFILIGQHIYFTKKIDTLSKKLEQNKEKLEGLEKDNKTLGLQKTDDSGSAPQALEQKHLEGNDEAAREKNTSQKKPESPIIQYQTPASPAQNTSTGNRPPNIEMPSGLAQTNVLQQPPLQSLPTPGQAIAADQEDVNREPAGATANAPAPGLLPSKSTLLLAEGTMPALSLVPVQPLTRPVRTPGRLSVGVHAMPMTTSEKITSLKPGMPHPDKKVFSESTQSEGTTFYAGLTAEYQASRHFYIGSGLDYRKTSITANHEAEFRFKDRRPHGGGHGGGEHGFEHDFLYDLNTAAGLVEVEIRAEQADTTFDFSDDDEIDLSVSTRQDLKYLSVPLYGRYELGKGTFRLYIRGGMVANFLQSNNFAINDVRSDNPNLRFDGKQQPGGTPQNLQTLSLDYLAGIGMDVALTKHLKLRLEPALSGSLTSSHNNPFIKSSQFSMGVNAGAMYVF